MTRARWRFLPDRGASTPALLHSSTVYFRTSSWHFSSSLGIVTKGVLKITPRDDSPAFWDVQPTAMTTLTRPERLVVLLPECSVCFRSKCPPIGRNMTLNSSADSFEQPGASAVLKLEIYIASSSRPQRLTSQVNDSLRHDSSMANCDLDPTDEHGVTSRCSSSRIFKLDDVFARFVESVMSDVKELEVNVTW